MKNKLMLSISILSLGLMSGCATTTVHKPSLNINNSYNTVVVRNRDITGKACKSTVYLDGNSVGTISAGNVLEFLTPLDNKEHILSAKSPSGLCGSKLDELSYTITDNQIKYFRIYYDNSSSFNLVPTNNLILK